MKLCKRCDATKPFDDFHKDRKAKDGLCFYCKECNKRKTRDYYASLDKTSEKTRGKSRTENGEYRNYQYMKKYGITLDEYNSLLEKQGGKCAICGITREECKDKRALPVDHNHETGHVRGILCHSCNRAVGLLKDSPTNLIQAAVYLIENRT
jgi:Recombination endonuclease VII